MFGRWGREGRGKGKREESSGGLLGHVGLFEISIETHVLTALECV
jgi:hypothetical protein